MVLFGNICRAVTGVAGACSAAYFGYMNYINPGHEVQHGLNLQDNRTDIFNTTTFVTIFPAVPTNICMPNAMGYLDYHVETVSIPSFDDASNEMQEKHAANTNPEPPTNELSGIISTILQASQSLTQWINYIIGFTIMGIPLHILLDGILLSAPFVLRGSRSPLRWLSPGSHSSKRPKSTLQASTSSLHNRLRRVRKLKGNRKQWKRLAAHITRLVRRAVTEATKKTDQAAIIDVSDMSTMTVIGQDDLHQKCKEYESQLTILRNDLAAANLGLQQVRAENENLQSQYTTESQTVTELRGMITAAVHERGRLERNVNQHKSKAERVQLDLENTSKKNAQDKVRIAELEEAVKTTKAQQKSTRAEQHVSSQQATQDAAKIAELEQVIKTTKTQRISAQAEQDASSKQLEQHKIKIAELEELIKTTKTQHKSSQAEQDEHAKSIADLKNKLNTAEIARKAAMTNKAELQDKFDKLKRDKTIIEQHRDTYMTEAQIAKARIQDLQGSIDSEMSGKLRLIEEIQELKLEKITQQEKLAVENELRAEIASLTQQVNAYQDEVTTLKKSETIQQASFTKLSQEKDTALSALNQKMQLINITKESLEKDLNTKAEKIRAMLQTQFDTEKDLNTKEERLKAMLQTKSEIEKENSQLKSEMKTLREQLSQASAKRVTEQAKAKGPHVPNIDMKELEINRAKMEMQQMSERAKGLVEQIIELKKEVATLNEENVNLKSASKEARVVVVADEPKPTPSQPTVSQSTAPTEPAVPTQPAVPQPTNPTPAGPTSQKATVSKPTTTSAAAAPTSAAAPTPAPATTKAEAVVEGVRPEGPKELPKKQQKQQQQQLPVKSKSVDLYGSFAQKGKEKKDKDQAKEAVPKRASSLAGSKYASSDWKPLQQSRKK